MRAEILTGIDLKGIGMDGGIKKMVVIGKKINLITVEDNTSDGRVLKTKRKKDRLIVFGLMGESENE